MKCIRMSFEQVQRMVARRDGYDDFEEWLEDTPEEERSSIYDLIGEPFDIVSYDGGKGYIFYDDKDRLCIWVKY